MMTDDRIEYERRLAAVRAAMESRGLDILVSGDSGDWLLPTGNARYLSNFSIGNLTNVVPGMAVVVPLKGEPSLIVPFGPQACWAEWARREAWSDDIRSNPGPAHAPMDGLLADTVAAIIDAGHGNGRIGISGVFAPLEGLARALPSAKVEMAIDQDGGGAQRDLIERVRSVKSEWEIKRLRAAQRATDAAMRVFMANVRPGGRHVENKARADLAAIEAGAQASITIMNCGNDPWMWWHEQGERRFQKDRIVTLETNARVDGYVAQLARSGVLGEPSTRQRQIHDIAVESLSAMLAKARVGVTGGDIWRAGNAAIAKAGMKPWSRFGHGMGLSMDECMGITSTDDNVLEVGACLAIHSSVFDPETNESYILGEQYVVRAEGLERLSATVPQHDLAPGRISESL